MDVLYGFNKPCTSIECPLLLLGVLFLPKIINSLSHIVHVHLVINKLDLIF